MTNEISELTMLDERDDLPGDEFSDAFESDFGPEDPQPIEEKPASVEKQTDEADAEEQPEEEDGDQEETLLKKLEKAAEERFKEAPLEEQEEKKEQEKPAPETQEEATVDFSDVESDTNGFLTKLVDSVKDTGLRGRLADLLDTNPEIGELAALVAKALVERQKVKVVKAENAFDFSKEEFEALNGKINGLAEAEEKRKLQDDLRIYWDSLEDLYPGARAKSKDKGFTGWLDKQSELVKKMTMTWNPEDYKQVLEAYEESTARTKAKEALGKQAAGKMVRDGALRTTSGRGSKPKEASGSSKTYEEYFNDF